MGDNFLFFNIRAFLKHLIIICGASPKTCLNENKTQDAINTRAPVIQFR